MEVTKDGMTNIVRYQNLDDFYRYISKTGWNNTFGDELRKKKNNYNYSGSIDELAMDKGLSPLSSITASEEFTGSNNYEDAIEMYLHGIPDDTIKLKQMLNAEKKMAPVNAQKRVASVQGFQPIVPAYLLGLPNSMLDVKMVPMKKKVVTLYSDISYSCGVSKDTIFKECIKKFRIISKLESQNYRVNLNLVIGSSSNGKDFVIVIRLKSANERMNISKLVFPITHPSMLRRLYFRFVEVYPDIPRGMLHGYGTPLNGSTIIKVLGEDGYLLPTRISKDVDSIKSLDDLKYL